MVFQNRSNFFSGIPPFHYLLQITLTDSTSNSSPTHSLQIPLFLSPLHLYIITGNHSHPFHQTLYQVSVTQTLHFTEQTIRTSSPITKSLILLVPSPFSKTHSSHRLLSQLDSNKPPSVQICIYIIPSTYRWVCNSVMTNQVMETTPC